MNGQQISSNEDMLPKYSKTLPVLEMHILDISKPHQHALFVSWKAGCRDQNLIGGSKPKKQGGMLEWESCVVHHPQLHPQFHYLQFHYCHIYLHFDYCCILQRLGLVYFHLSNQHNEPQRCRHQDSWAGHSFLPNLQPQLGSRSHHMGKPKVLQSRPVGGERERWQLEHVCGK